MKENLPSVRIEKTEAPARYSELLKAPDTKSAAEAALREGQKMFAAADENLRKIQAGIG